MKKNQLHLIIFLLLIALILSCSRKPLEKVVSKEFGFTPVKPPSNLIPPGTIVAITKSIPFQGTIVCTQISALGDSLIIPQSPTITVDLSKLTKGSFEIKTPEIENINAKLGGNFVKGVTLKIVNPTIYEIPDNLVFERAARKNKSKSCEKALFFRIENGTPITMIKKILQADIKYTIEYNGNLELNLKAELSNKIAVELGGEINSTVTSIVNGTGLIIGIVDDNEIIIPILNEMGSSLKNALSIDSTAKVKRILPLQSISISTQE